MYIVFGILTGVFAQYSYGEFRDKDYTGGIIFGIMALLSAMGMGYSLAL